MFWRKPCPFCVAKDTQIANLLLDLEDERSTIAVINPPDELQALRFELERMQRYAQHLPWCAERKDEMCDCGFESFIQSLPVL